MDQKYKPSVKFPSAKPQSPRDLETQTPPNKSPNHAVKPSLPWLDRLLALWIFLSMAIGIMLGNFIPNINQAFQKGKFVGVSAPIAVGLLVMMYPILCKVQYESLHKLFQQRWMWKQVLFSIFVNWVVAPFLMVSALEYLGRDKLTVDDSLDLRGLFCLIRVS